MRIATIVVALSLALSNPGLAQRLDLPSPPFLSRHSVVCPLSTEGATQRCHPRQPRLHASNWCQSTSSKEPATKTVPMAVPMLPAGITRRAGFGAGWAQGLLLSIIGTGIITAVGASSHPEPKEVPAGYDPACYRDGYESKAKSKNTVSALTGGLVGTAVLALSILPPGHLAVMLAGASCPRTTRPSRWRAFVVAAVGADHRHVRARVRSWVRAAPPPSRSSPGCSAPSCGRSSSVLSPRSFW